MALNENSSPTAKNKFGNQNEDFMNDIMSGMQEASPETRKNASSNSIQITP